MNEEHTGACLCGAVRFKTRGRLREVVACHCSQCRRQTGLYYAATDVPRGNITIEGEEVITWYRASSFARRGFCRVCGSALFWSADSSDNISIMAGLFDQPNDLKLGYHIYCADKGDFYEIDDGLPRYKQGRPGLLTAGPSE
ncbi:GFA family protein [Rhizobium sp. ICMP 5592]|uniref:GFA family protein n=1 Tax=Rhizobium sp. ICMP 5592 TaxID=2292445 RepID=UPI0012970F98|nr:GFA family protein [Rhizobium sp. ICMP 5592]MQB42833.1 GFA family protein [Rhizobium sp. ICMP 5592]